MKIITTIKEKVQKPRVQLAMGLTVAIAGFLAPHSSKSGCGAGSYGDCVHTADAGMQCSSGYFWNDCGPEAQSA